MNREKGKLWQFLTLASVVLTLSACGGPDLVISFEDTDAQVYQDVQLALEKQGYDPGPIDGGWSEQASSAMDQYLADQDLEFFGLDVAADMLGVTIAENCFWFDSGKFECAADCAVSRLAPKTAAPRFSVDCPGFENTLVTREPNEGEVLWASLWQKDWGYLDAVDEAPHDYEVHGSGTTDLEGIFRGIDLAKRIVVDVELDSPLSNKARVRCYLTEDTEGFSLVRPAYDPPGDFGSIYVANEGLLTELKRKIGQRVIVAPGHTDCLRLDFE